MTTITIETSSEQRAEGELFLSGGIDRTTARRMLQFARDLAPQEVQLPPFVARVRFQAGRHTDAGYEAARWSVEVPAAIPFRVGDGVTLHLYTDAHAYTVIKATAKSFTIQRDRAIPDPTWRPDFTPGGFMGHTANDRERKWTYEPDPTGATRTVRRTKRGWTANGQLVTPGRHEYYDSNF